MMASSTKKKRMPWSSDSASVAAAVAAVVVLHGEAQAGAEELRAFARQQLRSSRTPERVEFWPELPYNETGKVLRRVVRAKLTGEGD